MDCTADLARTGFTFAHALCYVLVRACTVCVWPWASCTFTCGRLHFTLVVFTYTVSTYPLIVITFASSMILRGNR